MKGFFVYMFLNELEEVLYIGYSINLAIRIETQHFINTEGNLTEECILETNRVLYHKAVSSDDMKIKERYLINTLEPKYNNKMNNKSKFSFCIEIDWNLYCLDIEVLIEKRLKKTELINHFLDINSDLLIIEKPNRKNYLMIDSENAPCHSHFFIKINNEYYFHNFNMLSGYASYNVIDGVRVYQNIEFRQSRSGSNIFIWVDSMMYDDILFRFAEDRENPFSNGESKELYNILKRKLLFIKYDFLRREDIMLNDNQIKKYDSLLGFTEIVERVISF